MKKREKRRYLTQKYQRRQIRLAYSISYNRPYDPYRYIRTTFAMKQRFLNDLMGNIVGPAWDDSRRSWKTNWMLGDPRVFTKLELGRFRRQSYNACGTPRCPSCSNPRRGFGWQKPKEQLTMAERRAKVSFEDDLALYHLGEYDDFLSS